MKALISTWGRRDHATVFVAPFGPQDRSGWLDQHDPLFGLLTYDEVIRLTVCHLELPVANPG